MTLALAQEKLHYAQPELAALSQQVQMGDLTAVMQIYEEDIKNPLRSAVQGTLLRSLFIQVQKAKVCDIFFGDCADIDALPRRWTSTRPSQASISCSSHKSSLLRSWV